MRSSDLSRARVTAEACTAATGLSLTIDPRLRELNLGQVRARASLKSIRRSGRTRPRTLSPAANTPSSRQNDSPQPFRTPQHQTPGGHVLVIAHSTVIRLALCLLLGIPLSNYRRTFPSLGNCTLTTIRNRPGRAGLLNYNCPLEPH